MASDRQLYRIEHESGMLFGLKWSAVGCLLALCFLLSACSLFESGAVRYNSVVGEKRVPTLNPGGVGYSSTAMAQNQSMVQNYQQTISMAPTPPMPQQEMVQQMPAQAAPLQAAPAPPPVAMDGSYPQLPPTATQQPLMGNDAAIQAEIAALERDMAATQAQRQQLAAQQQEDSWLPDLGVGDWFGGNSAAATPTAPQPQAATGYPPVQLPPPPGGAPMPPVITQPYQPPTAAEMAAASAAPSGPVDVPLAPEVGAAAPSNVPTSLIPPGASLAPGGGYLEDSRYSGRRASMRP